MKEIQVSSNWTKPMLVLMFLFWILGPIILYLFMFINFGFELKINVILSLIIALVLFGLTLYLTFSLSIVKIQGGEIKFKKMFRKERSYTFDKIGYSKTFRYKRLVFISTEMKNELGDFDEYLILNNNALLSGERINAKEILDSLRVRKG